LVDFDAASDRDLAARLVLEAQPEWDVRHVESERELRCGLGACRAPRGARLAETAWPTRTSSPLGRCRVGGPGCLRVVAMGVELSFRPDGGRSERLGEPAGGRVSPAPPSRQLEITHYTDPACPFAFSAEPVRWGLRWHYGEQLRWHTTMIVLTLEPGHAERLAEGAPGLQRRYGMPIDPSPLARPASCEPACRAVVAARLNAPGAEESLLRRLRVHAMAGGLLDEPRLIATAAREAGLDPDELSRWCLTTDVLSALQEDIAAARSPSRAARALDHKLGGPISERRYTAPSYEITSRERDASIAIPGFNPIGVYEVAIANLAPELVRRAKPADVEELLSWAGEPLATAEVAAVAQIDLEHARRELGRVARPLAVGADFFWTLGRAP
jgi:predicted DsbA family dithiol-disulfide isomerase